MAGEASAGCNGDPNQTIGQVDYGYTWSACWGDSGVDHDDEKDGDAGANITINTSASYTAGASLPYVVPSGSAGGVIMTYTMGGGGVDEGRAGAGGTVTITNFGAITLSASTDPGTIGSLISATSFGGSGDEDNDNYKSNGGAGGAGGAVTITNYGMLAVESLKSTTARGMAGIFAVSKGGSGGEQNSGATGDQVGGNGGNGGTVSIANTGQVNLGSPTSSLSGLDYAWGLAAESTGQQGGHDNGAGGAGGFVDIANGSSGNASAGAISVYANDTDSVRGIHGLSQGSDGTASRDSSDKGGVGGGGSVVNVDTYADMTIVATGQVTELSGGVVAVTRGGDGGDGWSSNVAGAGGEGGRPDSGLAATTVTVHSGIISTQGDDLGGVIALSQGGRGGDGQDGEKDSSGGLGGNGGQIQLNLSGGSVSTDGSNAFGLLGQSIGGQGGNGGDETAVVGTSGGGGYGGNAGSVGAFTNGASRITTTGDYSTAITLHSIGGGGGTGGDFTDVLGGGAGNGGNGGSGNTAIVNNNAAITTAGGHSYGILVQSIGGSGGTGGIAAGLTLELGGDGGSGGSAETAGVLNAGTITTSGYSAHGIIAQSISGGGGAAGMAGGILSIGGSGGSGNFGGNAQVQNSGVISTGGDAAIGILAQSIGGGGGSGAGASGIATVGGSGSAGGDGSEAGIFLPGGSVTTRGEMAHAIMAQSIGGGGGNGGNVIDLSVGLPALGVGGSASGGGAGGKVCVTNQYSGDGCSAETGAHEAVDVATAGSGAVGVLAQSIGGGGGNGGNATGGDAGLGSFQIGGGGGGGGYASITSVDFQGLTLTTQGSHAAGIVAQSVGGGGGTGGSASSYSAGLGFTASVAVGGTGGSGGAGGDVSVDLTDSIISTGQHGGDVTDAIGVLAQSISGGGGSGGSSVADALTVAVPTGEDVSLAMSVSTAVGGSGGSTHSAGDVSVSLDGSTAVSTKGASSHGVMAQSIGGGGGLGGSVGQASSGDAEPLDDQGASDCLSDDGDGKSGYCFDVNVGATIDDGGTGGTAANGNTVTLTHAGRINTTGDWADGIVAQSIGGGGGAGGSSTASGSQATANITVGVGGRGGAGGNGGEVDITFDDNHGNSINTSGYSAYGVLLQSIGGGGGQGGDGSDHAAGKITVGGGFGGSGGSGGSGGLVEAQGWINLSTSGDDAHGIVAQSIGGGGGVGGAGSRTASEDENSHAIDLVVGGSGGVGGRGGEVDLAIGTALNTYGDRAFGLVAQSIGGGGGIGGAGEADSIASLVVGGSGGSDTDGGAVTVDLTSESTVHTRGIGAHGIVAQSIGGGGGIGGTASGAPLSFKGDSPASFGDGDDVSVNIDGGILTDGDYSFGVLAQSIGGGGGFGGNATSAFIGSNGNLSSAGKSGDVTVTLDAGNEIRASGKDSIGILAQSDGGTANNGTVNVTVDGSITGGSGDNGAGVWVAGGQNNSVNVNSGGMISAASGVAVQYSAGLNPLSDGTLMVVNNAGIIDGSVKGATTVDAKISKTARVGSGMAVSVLNETGGLLTGAKVYEADVFNHGRLAVGGSEAIDATKITGNFAQRMDGVLAINADFAGSRIDRLTVEGDASLAGKFTVSAESVLPGITLSFLTAGGTLDHSLSGQSAIYDYVLTRTGNELSVATGSAHFGEPGFALNADQDNVADHLQEIWDAGGGSFGRLFGTLGSLADGDSGAYGSALSDISPGVAGAAAAGSIATTRQHLDLLLSCPMFAADTSFLTETECAWSQAGAQKLDQKASGGVSGFDSTTYALQAGAQVEVLPDWFVGFAGGYDRSAIRGDDGRVNADGDVLYAGASLKHEIGPWLLSGAVSGSYGWYDNVRTIRIPGFAGQAEGEPEVYNVSTRLRAAYTFAQDAYYVRPLVDLDLIYSHARSYRESGAGPLDLLINDTRQWSFTTTPAIEIGTRVDLSETTVMRAYAAAGVSFSSADSWDTSARLANAPAGVGAFESTVPLADVAGRLSAGVDIANADGFSLRVGYQGSFSDTYSSHGGTLRIAYKF